ncbi:FkbM family methyltransferase [Saccharibacillus brassicae]|uniref:FkbM family methyltransferase n=1 Tax=Saccharibacillus brassicae TaxID=2583377 RepID=A0A4Y6UXU7_SACBS|nr:FkbM family methyltransferase [Saccharibacillus brassicae]QDH20845.1 FkbM family methyltransferase [Saccharibacillus brassicae]
MHGTYIGGNKMLISPVFGGKLIVPSNDLSLSPDLIINGVIEGPLTKFLAKQVKQGDIVVDVGANIGYFSVLLGYLVGSGGRVFSFEANKYLYEYLIDNLSINYLRDRVSSYNIAIYSERKKLDFYASKKFMGNSSIHEHSDEYKANYEDEFEKLEVDAITLPEAIGNIEEIKFLKIDIEGGELQAFIGMDDWLRSGRIKTVIFELNQGMLQGDWEDFTSMILNYEQSGKTFYGLSDEGDLIAIKVNDVIELGGYPFVVMSEQ